MIEYTPDQLLFVESFTTKRDALTLEVGMLTHEKEQLLEHNKNVSEINASLQKGIDDMNANAAKLGFEQAEKIDTLKKEVSDLESQIEVLKQKRDLLTIDTEEKNNTLINLGLLINTIKSSTEETVEHIRGITGTINTYVGRIESATNVIESDSSRVKGYIDEFSNVIDTERKANYIKSKEIDDRENAVIGREKFVETKYQDLFKKKI